MSETEIAADNLGLMAVIRASLAASGIELGAPPYRVRFQLRRGERWPDCELIISVGEYSILGIATTEPRLKPAAQWLLEETS